MVDSDQSYDKLTFRYLLVSQILSNLIGRLVNQILVLKLILRLQCCMPQTHSWTATDGN